jgi:hypothetical protein
MVQSLCFLIEIERYDEELITNREYSGTLEHQCTHSKVAIHSSPAQASKISCELEYLLGGLFLQLSCAQHRLEPPSCCDLASRLRSVLAPHQCGERSRFSDAPKVRWHEFLVVLENLKMIVLWDGTV